MKYIFGTALAVLAAAAGAAFLYWSDKAVQTTEYPYEDRMVPAVFDGFRIVQVSDLQSQYFGAGQRGLLAAVRKAEPDIIVFTGDLLDRNHTDYEASLTAVEGLLEIAPVYFVNGNHELALPQECVSQMYDKMESIGVRVLMDETAVIEKDGGSLYIGGLSEEVLYESKMRGSAVSGEHGHSRRKVSDTDIDGDYLRGAMKKLTDEMDSSGLFVLLVHEPQFFETYAGDKVNLIFAGHAHGGQIRLPFTEGLFAPGQGILPKMTSGIHRKMGTPGADRTTETTMVISRGLGNSTFPFRVFNRPEIVVVTLKQGQRTKKK